VLIRGRAIRHYCNRYEVAEFAKAADALGVRYLGLCCGAGPHHVRVLAAPLGRRPPASCCSPDLARHSYFGTAPGITAKNRAYAARL
jgi:betaine-homocysteine S-methyltransferase